MLLHRSAFYARMASNTELPMQKIDNGQVIYALRAASMQSCGPGKRMAVAAAEWCGQ
jgi:hypothetical protein